MKAIALSTGGRIAKDVNNRVVVKALDGVSLSVERGDRLALLGHNGAGKSTLLQLMAGIYEPERGFINTEGKIAALLGGNPGMDPESTGRENIVLQGLLLGLSKAEIRKSAESIIDFTELGSFIDFPLRTYSTGMRARLAFGIATVVTPEILLLDEGLGAGDASFIEKAHRRLVEFVDRIGILALASHSEPLVREFCNKYVILERGRIVSSGDCRTFDDAFVALRTRA